VQEEDPTVMVLSVGVDDFLAKGQKSAYFVT